MKVGAVNCDKDRTAKKKYKIQQSPTVKIFASIKKYFFNYFFNSIE